ncbi:MAG: hypothetical protein ACLFST_03690 [Spirochaetia bacterium]
MKRNSLIFAAVLLLFAGGAVAAENYEDVFASFDYPESWSIYIDSEAADFLGMNMMYYPEGTRIIVLLPEDVPIDESTAGDLELFKKGFIMMTTQANPEWKDQQDQEGNWYDPIMAEIESGEDDGVEILEKREINTEDQSGIFVTAVGEDQMYQESGEAVTLKIKIHLGMLAGGANMFSLSGTVDMDTERSRIDSIDTAVSMIMDSLILY